jgi:hypothetical protein
MTPRSVGGALAALAVLSATLTATTPVAAAAAPDADLLAHYAFTETAGATVPDLSGHGRHGAVVGEGSWTGAALALPGGAGNAAYVALPDDLLAGQAEATVSVEVRPDGASLSRAGFLWNVGGTSDTGSWFVSANGTLRASITPSNWSGEQNAAWTGRNLTAGVWQNVTTTLAGNGDGTSTMTLYVDGTQVAQNTGVTLTPADLGAHGTNRIGGSAYAADHGFAGEVAETRVYARALDAAEVAAVADADATSTAADLAAALDLGDTSAVTADLVLPATATWTTSDAAVVTSGGAITRPRTGEGPRSAELTATVTVRGAVETRTFAVTVPELADGETALPPASDQLAHYPLNASWLDHDTTRDHQIGGVTRATWAQDHLDLSDGGYVANNAFTGFTLPGDSVALAVDVAVPAAASGSSSSTLLTYGSHATATNVSFRPFWTDGSSAAVVTVDGTVVAVAETDQPLARDVWQHLVVVLDGDAGALRVHVNGDLAAEATDPALGAAAVGDGVLRLNRDATAFYDVPSRYRDLKVYGSAVTEDEALALARVNAAFGWQQLVDGLDLPAQVTGDVRLPGTPLVTWTSSDPAVLAEDGTVTRPAPGAPDVPVTLTATLARGGLDLVHDVQVVVPALLSDAEQAAQDAAALTVAAELRTTTTLPGDGPVHGSAVSWSSGDVDLVALVTEDGTTYAQPSRPAYGLPAAAATLTATVRSGTAVATRELEVTTPPLPRAVDDEAYVFAYFTANTVEGENVYLAASNGNDALSWRELNGGEWVVTSEHGERGLRDPFLIRSVEGDTFYLIATDLSIGRDGDWGRAQTDGSQYIEIWESTDLVHWSEQRHVKVSPDSAGMTWAPEAYYDDDLEAYVVFWASRLFTDDTRTTCLTTDSGSGCYARMMYATTRDFVTFSEPQIWQDTGSARIDSTVLKDGDHYYRFTKDEGGQTGCTDIIAEKSAHLTDVTTTSSLAAGTGWTSVSTCIARASGFTGAVEGPTIFRANPGDTSAFDYYLYLDNYGGSGYFPLGTDDLDAPVWTRVSGALPASRHGTVLPVTQRQWAGVSGEAAASTASTTQVALTDRTLTATVAAADGFEVGGAVTFSSGSWSTTGYLTGAVATAVLPDDVHGTVTATFAGTEEVTGSQATVDVAGPDEPGPSPAPEQVEVTWSLAPGATVRAGDRVGATVAGAPAGAEVALELRPAPTRLAWGTAVADRATALTGTVPGDVTAGAHRLVVLVDGADAASLDVTVGTGTGPGGEGPPGTDPVDRSQPAGDGLAVTGSTGLLLALLLASALLVAGAVVLTARHQQRRPHGRATTAGEE